MLAVLAGLFSTPTGFASAAERLGKESGEPLPRFAVLKDSIVNMRLGPGKAYAIKWVLRRRNMPVRIIGEHGYWRRVELVDGDQGWIHRALLTRRRYAVATSGGFELYATPEDSARMIARVKPALPVRLLSCEADWCRAEVEGKRGWAPKRNLWGIGQGEIFD